MKESTKDKLSFLFGALGIVVMILAVGFAMDYFWVSLGLVFLAGGLFSVGAALGGYYDETT